MKYYIMFGALFLLTQGHTHTHAHMHAHVEKHNTILPHNFPNTVYYAFTVNNG